MVSLFILESGADTGIVRGDGRAGPVRGGGQGGSGGADPRGLGQGIRKKVNCKSVNLTLKTSILFCTCSVRSACAGFKFQGPFIFS